MTTKQRFKTIEEYIRACPKDVQRPLERLRRTIHKAAPGAVETISYHMPTFKLNGRFLVSFAVWRHHIGLYPIPSGPEAFRRAISQYKEAKSSVRLPLEKPIPYELVAQLVTLRMQEESKRER